MVDMNQFRLVITETINYWPSFQVCIQNGMGGSNVQEKIDWMYDVIIQLFQDNQNLIVQDLTDFLADILNNEFDSIIEDGSLEMVCSNIFCFYNNLLSGNTEFVTNQLIKLKQKYVPPKSAVESQDELKEKSTHQVSSSTPEDIEMTNNQEEEGWTVVRRKK